MDKLWNIITQFLRAKKCEGLPTRRPSDTVLRMGLAELVGPFVDKLEEIETIDDPALEKYWEIMVTVLKKLALSQKFVIPKLRADEKLFLIQSVTLMYQLSVSE